MYIVFIGLRKLMGHELSLEFWFCDYKEEAKTGAQPNLPLYSKRDRGGFGFDLEADWS